MKKIMIALFVLSIAIIGLNAKTTITQKNIDKWSAQCFQEFKKNFANVDEKSQEGRDLKNSINDNFKQWFEAYNDIKNNKNVDMWKFRAESIQDSLKMKCPEAAKNLPDLTQ